MSGIFDAGIFDAGIFHGGVIDMVGSSSIPRTRRGTLTVFANPASSGSNTILAAQGVGAKIRVTSLIILASGGANTISFTSDTTDISADFALPANGGFVLDINPTGWFETAANEALNIDLSAATAVAVQINYKLTR